MTNSNNKSTDEGGEGTSQASGVGGGCDCENDLRKDVQQGVGDSSRIPEQDPNLCLPSGGGDAAGAPRSPAPSPRISPGVKALSLPVAADAAATARATTTVIQESLLRNWKKAVVAASAASENENISVGLVSGVAVVSNQKPPSQTDAVTLPQSDPSQDAGRGLTLLQPLVPSVTKEQASTLSTSTTTSIIMAKTGSETPVETTKPFSEPDGVQQQQHPESQGGTDSTALAVGAALPQSATTTTTTLPGPCDKLFTNTGAVKPLIMSTMNQQPQQGNNGASTEANGIESSRSAVSTGTKKTSASNSPIPPSSNLKTNGTSNFKIPQQELRPFPLIKRGPTQNHVPIAPSPAIRGPFLAGPSTSTSPMPPFMMASVGAPPTPPNFVFPFNNGTPVYPFPHNSSTASSISSTSPYPASDNDGSTKVGNATKQALLTPECFKNRKLRAGKWLAEEEAYAELLIDLFDKGMIPDCENGATLRSYLAQKLHCAPMRISKKYAGKGIGKMVYLNKMNPSLMPPLPSTSSAAVDENAKAEERKKIDLSVKEAAEKFYKAASPAVAEFRAPQPEGATATAAGTNGNTAVVPAYAHTNQAPQARVPQNIPLMLPAPTAATAPVVFHYAMPVFGVNPFLPAQQQGPSMPQQQGQVVLQPNIAANGQQLAPQGQIQLFNNQFQQLPQHAMVVGHQPSQNLFPQQQQQSLAQLTPACNPQGFTFTGTPVALNPNCTTGQSQIQSMSSATQHAPKQQRLVSAGPVPQSISQEQNQQGPPSVAAVAASEQTKQLREAFLNALSQISNTSGGTNNTNSIVATSNNDQITTQTAQGLVTPSINVPQMAMNSTVNSQCASQAYPVMNPTNDFAAAWSGHERKSTPAINESDPTHVSQGMLMNPYTTATVIEPNKSGQEPDLPDFLCGFDLVVQSMKTSDLSRPSTIGNETNTGTSHASSTGCSNIGDNENLFSSNSPAFTSRSFDDFHRFLGKEELPTLDESLQTKGTGCSNSQPQVSQGKGDTSDVNGNATSTLTNSGNLSTASTGVTPDTMSLFTAESYAMFAQESAMAASQHAAYQTSALRSGVALPQMGNGGESNLIESMIKALSHQNSMHPYISMMGYGAPGGANAQDRMGSANGQGLPPTLHSQASDVTVKNRTVLDQEQQNASKLELKNYGGLTPVERFCASKYNMVSGSEPSAGSGGETESSAVNSLRSNGSENAEDSTDDHLDREGEGEYDDEDDDDDSYDSFDYEEEKPSRKRTRTASDLTND